MSTRHWTILGEIKHFLLVFFDPVHTSTFFLLRLHPFSASIHCCVTDIHVHYNSFAILILSCLKGDSCCIGYCSVNP